MAPSGSAVACFVALFVASGVAVETFVASSAVEYSTRFSYSATPTGASFSHDGRCSSDRPPSPCVLPMNANISLLDPGAGTATTVDVTLDVYPGPSCVRLTGSNYLKDWDCLQSPNSPPFHDPLEHAIVHDEVYMTLIRIILPEGFDASLASLVGGVNDTGFISLGNVTNTTTVTGTSNVSSSSFDIVTNGAANIAVRILPRPQAFSFGTSEPSPARVPVEIEGYANYPIVEYRTGTNWAQRDPLGLDGAFDHQRVVDLVTVGIIDPLENPLPAPNDVDPWGVTPSRYNDTQRVSFALAGVVNRRVVGQIESAMATGRRVVAAHIYKVRIKDFEDAAASGTVPPAGAALLRYYNTRARDPCAAGENRSWVDAAGDVQDCPREYTPEANARKKMTWFDATNTDALEMLCPAGTAFINRTYELGEAKECSNCPAGTASNRTMSLECTQCPTGTFSDKATALYAGLGATKCTTCGPGRFAEPGSLECSGCDAGSYSSSSGGGCALCPRGFYSTNSSSSVCDKCPVGTSTNTPGADTVALCKEPCAAGSVGIGGFQPCTLCLPGEFGPVAGSHECLRCPPGQITAGYGATDCEVCEAGTFSAGEGSSLCELCPRHTFSAAPGATVCESCPVDVSAVDAAAARGEILEPLPTLLTIATGITTADECFKLCDPGTATILQTATPAAPCELCLPGEFAAHVGAMQCSSCPGGTYQDEAGATACKPCLDGLASDLDSATFCGMCTPGRFSKRSPEGTRSCSPCPNGTYAPGPGASTCGECPEGTYSSPTLDACIRCLEKTTTLARFASGVTECVSFVDVGVVAHWELTSAEVVQGSSFSRPPLSIEGCRETGEGIQVAPSDIRDLAGGIGPASLRGPVCAQASDWDLAGARGIGVDAMLATAGGVASGLLADGPLNPGLVVGEVDSLVESGRLPTEAIAVEAWFTVGETDAMRSGVVGALQQGPDYGKGWALLHWRDRNRGDAWFVSLLIGVEANDATFADFASWRSAGASAGSRGGLTSIVARVSPAPKDGEWVHVVADYDSAVSLARIFVNGLLVASLAPCGGACGKIQYPRRSDYWAAARPSLFTIGGVDNAAATGPEGLILHQGVVGMVRIYARRFADAEALVRYKLREARYASAPKVLPWYWVASRAEGLKSPSLSEARTNANTPAVRASRGGDTLFLTVLGRFPVEQVPSLRCRWVWGGATQDTAPGAVLDPGGRVLSIHDAEVGDMLRCTLPEWLYGATSSSASSPILAVFSDTMGLLWQRTCSAASCGFAAGVRGDAVGDPWWARAGLGALSGGEVPFTFVGDDCGLGSASPRGGSFPWCQLCNPGSYAPRRAMVACLLCPKGFYAAQDGSEACSACPAEQSTPGTGAAAADECVPFCTRGTYSAEGADTAPCWPCPQGTYAPEAGMGACLPCEAGQGTFPPSDGVGAASCREECHAGYVGQGGLEPCTICEPGTISATAGASECTVCPLGKFTGGAGNSVCLDCPDTCELALLGDGADDQAFRETCCVA